MEGAFHQSTWQSADAQVDGEAAVGGSGRWQAPATFAASAIAISDDLLNRVIHNAWKDGCRALVSVYERENLLPWEITVG